VSRALATRLSPQAWGENLFEEFSERLKRGSGRYRRARPLDNHA